MKNKKLVIGGLLIIVPVVALGYIAYSHQYMGWSMPGMMGRGADYHAGMMHQDDGMQITSEREFIHEMVPHHQEAIATAQEVLERGGTTPGMVALAENIITSQTKEVAFMKTSYQEWYGTAYEDTGEYQPMMRELAEYQGEQLDLIFLHDMTMHHMGAIAMARALQGNIEHESMQDLSDAIIVNQMREIQTMQRLYQEIRSTREE